MVKIQAMERKPLSPDNGGSGDVSGTLPNEVLDLVYFPECRISSGNSLRYLSLVITNIQKLLFHKYRRKLLYLNTFCTHMDMPFTVVEGLLINPWNHIFIYSSNIFLYTFFAFKSLFLV